MNPFDESELKVWKARQDARGYKVFASQQPVIWKYVFHTEGDQERAGDEKSAFTNF